MSNSKKPRFTYGSWYRDPQSYFFPKFVQKDGHILVDWRGDEGASFQPRLTKGSDAVAIEELNWNFVYLEHYWAQTPFENWRINLCIAQAMRECWLAQLRRQFPDRTFQAPIRDCLKTT